MLLVPFGDDLRFNEEKEWDSQFDNLTMLMDYMNAQSDMNIEVCLAFMSPHYVGFNNILSIHAHFMHDLIVIIKCLNP